MSVSVSDNTAPMLLIDRARFNLVVGEKNYSVPVAVDPDGDVLSYKIQPGGDFSKRQHRVCFCRYLQQYADIDAYCSRPR